MVIPRYAISPARPREVPALAVIERAAAVLLEGYAPASVPDETTEEHELRAAQAEDRLWVALGTKRRAASIPAPRVVMRYPTSAASA
jgi:hypothetical protein